MQSPPASAGSRETGRAAPGEPEGRGWGSGQGDKAMRCQVVRGLLGHVSEF